MVNLLKRKESDDSKITLVSQWFHSYITELNKTMLRKLLKFCTGFNGPASFDEQFFFFLDFSPNEILPRVSACTFNLFLPLKFTAKEKFFCMCY